MQPALKRPISHAVNKVAEKEGGGGAAPSASNHSSPAHPPELALLRAMEATVLPN